MLIKRRSFLQTGALASAAVFLPRFLQAMDSTRAVPPGNKVLVVLQFSGGNDGLNTIIPTRNDVYYQLRPRLAIKRDQALTLTDEVGIHPTLVGFKSLYDSGELAILNSVGYPNPDRSHFRSLDIWHSASAANEYINTGWLGRYLDAQCRGCDKPIHAVEIDDTLSLALKGEQVTGLAFTDPNKLYNSSNDRFFAELAQAKTDHDHEPVADYLYKTMRNTLNSAQHILDKSKQRSSPATYPATNLGKDFKTIASLILSDIQTKVYYVSVGSFDTHVNQEGQQKRLFQEINDAVTAFVNDMKANHRFDDVLLMTFSEFGRRVKQNASNGTDHGTANHMCFISGALQQKGLLNNMPNLTNLLDGDLQHEVDFRNVYATILKKWLNTDDRTIIDRQASYLGFV